MKQKFLTAILLLLTMVAPFTALADSFRVLETDLELGKTGTLQFVLENAGDVYGFQANLKLPDGVTAVAKGTDGSVDITLSSRAEAAAEFQVNSNTKSDGTIIFGAFSGQHKPFSGTSGVLAELKVSVAETFKGGTVEVSNIKLINAANKDVPAEDATTTLGVKATGLTLSETAATLKVGGENGTITLTATVTPESATNKTVNWSSDKESVATVKDGVVTGVALGSATITASCGTLTATCEVTVEATPVESITLSNATLTLKEGTTATLTATLNPTTATDKAITWKSSDETVATVSADGTVTAVKDGKATITATSSNGKTASCEVTVSANIIEVTAITIGKTELTLTIGEKAPLSASVTPENATDKTITWTSSDEAIATVSATGEVTAVKDGEVTITAASSNGKTAVCTLTVNPIAAESVTLNETAAELKVGGTVELTATVLPDNTTYPTVTWSSSDEKVATVVNGKVTAIALGEATITATCGTVSATCKVSVVKTPVESITLSETTLSLIEEETATLTATVAPSDATYKTVTWTSSDAAVATVENGVVTAVAPGSATITATADGISATCTVTVKSKVIEVSGVTLDQATATLTEGDTLTLTATIEPADATTDKTLTWSSSDEAVATVENGVVTAVKAGNATITVTTANGKTAECAITVEKAPVAITGITLNKTAATLAEGENLYLLATAAPTDATDKSVTWSSSDKTVATVAANGKVTALKAGTATIKATSNENEAISASCTVTVTAKNTDVVAISWPMILDGAENLSAAISEGAVGLTAGDAALGSAISCVGTETVNGVSFAKLQPAAKVTKVTEGHTVTFSVETAEGYTFQPTGFEYIATKLGTDGGTYDLEYSWNGTTVNLQKEFQPNRNNVGFYSPESFSITDAAAASGKFEVTFSIYNLNDNKQIGLSNVIIKGKVEKAAEPIAVTGITLDMAEATIVESKSLTLKATVAPEDATDKTVTWESDNEAVATVDANGKVTGIAVGTANITAKAGDFSATCVVTVEENLAVISEGTAKMTYVNMDEPDTAYGEIAAGESAKAGFNKVSGGSVGFGNTGWNVNYITYLQVDASALEGTIIGATLSFEGSGSTDSKRTTSWGVGYNSSAWSADMTYNTADKNITLLGAEKAGTTKSAGTFEKFSFDITDAVKNADENGLVTILVYETAAAGGYIKNPVVSFEWTKEQTYNVSFTETSGVEGVKVTLDGTDVTNGTALVKGTYSFTATADHYKDYTGNFTVAGEDLNVEFEMTPKAIWNYTVKNNVNSEVKTGTTYEGESATVTYHRYILAEDGTVWKKDASNKEYKYTFTPDADNFVATIEYTATDMTDGIYFIEGEDIEGMTVVTGSNADIRCSNGAGGHSDEAVEFYSLKAGTYKVSMGVFGNAGATFIIKAGGETILSSATQGYWLETVSEEFTLESETTLTFEGSTSNKPLDYILITGKEDILVSGITLNKTNAEMTVGETLGLTATVTPADATHSEVTWTSSNEKVATIDENGNVTAIGVGTAILTAHCFCGEETADCAVKVYPTLGDANMDGKLDITDAVDITNYVVEKKTVADEEMEYYVKAANANGDEEGNITVADAAATVSLMLDQPTPEATQTRISAFADDAADALVIGRAAATSLGTVVPVALDNSMEYVALQADIFLPEGCSVDVKEGSRIADSHILMTRKHADNHIRVAIYNLRNEAIAEGNAAILEIVADSNIEASDIVISNIVASDSDANGYILGAKLGATTGVAAIGLDGNAPVKVFDVNGIYVSDTMEGLPQGTYIIRQGDEVRKLRVR